MNKLIIRLHSLHSVCNIEPFKITMHIFGKIILICMLHHALATSPPSSETEKISNWNQSLLLSMLRPPTHGSLEPFYDVLVGDNNHSIAFLHWNSTIGTRGGFVLVTLTHEFSTDSKFQEPCVIQAKEDIEYLIPTKLVYLRNDRVLVFSRQQHKTKGPMKVPQVINTASCKIENGVDMQSYIQLSSYFIVPFKNTFDVVFNNQALCPQDSWCKMTFDHDGKKISDPTSLFDEKKNLTSIERIYPINSESGQNGYVIITKNEGEGIIDDYFLYSSMRGWVQADDLSDTNHVYSNVSGYASICWQSADLKSIKCTRLDGTHWVDKGSDAIITIPLNGDILATPHIRNGPKGKVIISNKGLEKGHNVIYSDIASLDGKCKRYLKTDFTNNLKRVELTMLDNQKSCISLVTKNREPVSKENQTMVQAYEFKTACYNLKDYVPKNIKCGKGYSFF